MVSSWFPMVFPWFSYGFVNVNEVDVTALAAPCRDTTTYPPLDQRQ